MGIALWNLAWAIWRDRLDRAGDCDAVSRFRAVGYRRKLASSAHAWREASAIAAPIMRRLLFFITVKGELA
jgi:hypothetical protein